MSENNYNFIYSKLVEDEDDILGIIAYSFYKRQKIEFINDIKNTNDNEPNENDLKLFYGISNSESQLESYRLKAITLAQKFLDEALSEKVREIENDYDKKVKDEVKSVIPGFWMGVTQNAIASLASVFLIGGIIFLSWSMKYGISNAIESVFNVKIINAQPHTESTQVPEKIKVDSQ
ncbi:MAG: hypothetical protein PHC94_11460 [Methylobacter sp.]|nr:hypothetical protein [Methylobacter sp.]